MNICKCQYTYISIKHKVQVSFGYSKPRITEYICDPTSLLKDPNYVLNEYSIIIYMYCPWHIFRYGIYKYLGAVQNNYLKHLTVILIAGAISVLKTMIYIECPISRYIQFKMFRDNITWLC